MNNKTKKPLRKDIHATSSAGIILKIEECGRKKT